MSCPVSAKDTATTAGAAGRKRTPTACEACRVDKIRCLPSDEPGVCQKCLISKKECVSRTGPRRRRPNRSMLAPGNHLPPPPKPSGTFTIDIPLSQPFETASAAAAATSSAESLRHSHSNYLDNLFPASSNIPSLLPWSTGSLSESSCSASSPSAASSTTTTTTNNTTNTTASNTRPRFNLASAASLLEFFRGMLTYCPVILLPADVTVRDLARTRPFVLLAILAAAAGARSLQGHSLYDDEFRRVFALKLVAGGERSVELLQGILIYCLWYPFHLRPRVKQVFQYTRMAADLVHDLELDVSSGHFPSSSPMTPERLDSIRAYVAQHYLSSSFSVTWQAHRNRRGPVPFTAWTEHCCELLTQHAECPGDAVLAWLARLGCTVRDAWGAVRDAAGGSDNNSGSNSSALLFRGLEAQFREQQASLPPAVSNALPIRLQLLFTEFFLLGGSILGMPTAIPPQPITSCSTNPFQLSSVRLTACVGYVAQFLALIRSLPSTELACFSNGDWGRLVLAVVVSMRVSFPLPHDPTARCECGCCPGPGLDSAWVRDQLKFAEFLNFMTKEAPTDLATAAKRADIVSASKVVLAVVKEKYERRLELLQQKQRQQEQQQQPHQQQEQQQQQQQQVLLPRSRCPMVDGSLEAYFPFWDGSSQQSVSAPPLSSVDDMVQDTDAFIDGMAHGTDESWDTWAEEMLDWVDASKFMQ
ncbi:hypothetical protein BB8028_0005g06580 [Beauveria bassiana]|uniref:Zn(2)-C6 fungal-type domain-containing protein n=1 Tax=Beauveria bassiana TaxID=176275 RepID=A0A2S7YGM0_BEABA|nr:hypothetical protein BB8028_0005g06580 [Beauveria bassiana]